MILFSFDCAVLLPLLNNPMRRVKKGTRMVVFFIAAPDHEEGQLATKEDATTTRWVLHRTHDDKIWF